ncbi:MAG: PGF-CTERM sorting domain-containing protein, partial [Methanomicrobium sp.]|nr:PGF-CTERM sorting domain-containing protein [Methanomicrobium sp.]
GQYFVVVQHPMYNGVFDVKTQYNENGNTVQVTTDPKGTKTASGAAADKNQATGIAFIIAGTSKLQGSDAAEALITSINSANVDDTYTKLTFLVEEPWIRVNSVGDHYIGDQFKITGTTNLAVGDDLIVEVTSSSFQPTQKTQSGEFSGVSSTVKVSEGSSYNEWALDVDASTFKADEYIVNVEAIEADCTTTTTFNILSGSATVAPTSAPTTAPTTKPTTAPTTAPTPAATASPGFGALVALIGLGAVAALIIRKD